MPPDVQGGPDGDPSLPQNHLDWAVDGNDSRRSEMTRKDRNDLAGVARMNARVAKSDVEQREAALRAQVEEELSAIFSAEDENWRQITLEAKDHIDRANREIAARCEELGIRKEFQPCITQGWAGRGENSVASRRTELRLLAKARIEAMGKRAKVAIDKSCASVVTRLVAGGLDSEEAVAFLAEMPTVEALMQAPTVAELEAVNDAERDERRRNRGY